jgi:exodeoxyribonuclease V alpha subunit
MLTAAELLAPLRSGRACGLLRALDLAFAGFLHELDPQAPASLLQAAAWLAQLEGQGHSCLPLEALPGRPQANQALQALGTAGVPWPADAAAARLQWGGSALIEFDPDDDEGSSPLVLCGARLYLRRYWRFERRVARQIASRVGVPVEGLAEAAPAAPPDPAAARALFQRLFGAPGASPDGQQVACALALRHRLTLVTGGPGTGKTFTAARLLVLQQQLHCGPRPLRVALAAPTGKAAARLHQSIEAALQQLPADLTGGLNLPPARTLHALLGGRPGARRYAHDAFRPLPVDLLVLDEASMVHLEMMDALLDALPRSAKLILLGDPDQLASVEAGNVLGELCRDSSVADRTPAFWPGTVEWVRAHSGQRLPTAEPGSGSALGQQTVVLGPSHRFGGLIGQLAVAVNRGDAPAATALLRGGGEALGLIESGDPAELLPLAVQGHAAYLQALSQRPVEPAGASATGFEPWALGVLEKFDGFRVLCALRDGPWGVTGLNAAIERALAQRGLLPQGSRQGEWYAGRPVMVTRNDPGLGVFNGDIGIVLPFPRTPGAPPAADRLRVCFRDGAGLRSVAPGRLAEVQTAYAMTVHKSQGSEFGHVALVLPGEDAQVLTRELLYTGITRARRAFTLVAPGPQLLAAACARRTRRFSGLSGLLAELERAGTP